MCMYDEVKNSFIIIFFSLLATKQKLKSLKAYKNKKGITFVIPFDALQDGLEPTTP